MVPIPVPMPMRLFLFALTAAALAAAESPIPRAERGMPQVTVTNHKASWTIAGQKQTVTIDTTNLGIHIQSAGAAWDFFPSTDREVRVRSNEQNLSLRLADAQQIRFSPYDTGYSTGVKINLSHWPRPGIRAEMLDLAITLTVALDGPDEDLVCTASADEQTSAVRQLDWPGPTDAHEVDDTILPNGHGTLLPRTWPKEYNPIRPHLGDANAQTDTSFIQSNVIECWSMSWWGFEKGPAALMAIVQTPDDAAYQFSHPPGGPTVIGPRWRESLGRLSYVRSIRYCFLPHGNYVAMAKRYRQYAIDRGLFVPLKEKIARTPAVAGLIGTPLTRLSILHNLKPGSADFERTAPEKRRVLHTYDERIKELQDGKASGLEHLEVCLTGWPNQGYDRQHPDELPPSPEAGGWDGLKRFVEACRQLGYPVTFHDQYRDYYPDAASYDPQFAIREQDEAAPALAFPGTRFGGGTKQGTIPFLDNWEGGSQTYLSPQFMLGHLKKNYVALAAHGITPDGVYLDVFGYVPPDEDFNPEHPETRSQGIADRIACYRWVRTHVGIVGTEAGCDWTVPEVDVSSPVEKSRVIDIPLFNLVYHDAILTPYTAKTKADLLRGLLNGGLPQIMDFDHLNAENAPLIKALEQLNRRVALLEMTSQKFLDANRKREETRFADGTVVTVDWDAQSFTVTPELTDH